MNCRAKDNFWIALDCSWMQKCSALHLSPVPCILFLPPSFKQLGIQQLFSMHIAHYTNHGDNDDADHHRYKSMKLTSSQAPSYARRLQSETMNYSLTHLLTGVKCGATSVAKNLGGARILWLNQLWLIYEDRKRTNHH